MGFLHLKKPKKQKMFIVQRDKYEDSFYRNLKKMGFEDSKIKEPDKDSEFDQKICQPDFLIVEQKIVFEVKHPEMTPEDIKEEKRIQTEIKKKGKTGFIKPVRNTSFTEAVKDSEKKFLNYPSHHSILVYDLSDYLMREPDIQMMLEGIMEIKINTASESPHIIGQKYTKRSFRIDKHREIGAVLFVRKVRHYLIHNLMAKNERLLPLWMWNTKIGFFYCDQFAFVNLPKNKMLLQKLR